jgi:hypothetical protein
MRPMRTGNAEPSKGGASGGQLRTHRAGAARAAADLCPAPRPCLASRRPSAGGGPCAADPPPPPGFGRWVAGCPAAGMRTNDGHRSIAQPGRRRGTVTKCSPAFPAAPLPLWARRQLGGQAERDVRNTAQPGAGSRCQGTGPVQRPLRTAIANRRWSLPTRPCFAKRPCRRLPWRRTNTGAGVCLNARNAAQPIGTLRPCVMRRGHPHLPAKVHPRRRQQVLRYRDTA